MNKLNFTMDIQTKEQWVLHKLEKFYSNPAHFARVEPIVKGTSSMSLRLIDWFVTNYAKKHNISYLTKEGKYIIVHLEYKSHLKAYSKKVFDPFCRWKRIQFMDMNTTVGQLNFFQWVIEDEVLDYLEAHCQEVQKDMDENSTTLQPLEGGRRKRHELSRSATKSVCHHNIKVPVKFD